MPAGAFFFLEYFVKQLTKYSRRGLLGEIFDKLRIQGRMQIFRFLQYFTFLKVWLKVSEAGSIGSDTN